MPGKRRTPEQRAANAAYTRDYYWENRDEIRAKARASHEARKSDPEYVERRKQYRRTFALRDRYGVTPEKYEEMSRLQEGKCALCGKVPDGRGSMPTLGVDHDHTTGSVRALLCRTCNSALGLLNDDPELIARAAQYVYSHQPLTVMT